MSESESTPQESLQITERIDWNALLPRSRFKIDHPARVIILRYTNTDPCTTKESCSKTVRDLQYINIEENNGADILHSFLIGGDGRVYEGTGWTFTTPKDNKYAEYDFENIDIAYIGRNHNDVSPEMRLAARKLMELGMVNEYTDTASQLIGEQTAIDQLHT